MKKFNVSFFYLATGMEGKADEREYGVVTATCEDEAKNKIVMRELPIESKYGPDNSWSTRDFFKGCLTATEIT